MNMNCIYLHLRFHRCSVFHPAPQPHQHIIPAKYLLIIAEYDIIYTLYVPGTVWSTITGIQKASDLRLGHKAEKYVN